MSKKEPTTNRDDQVPLSEQVRLIKETGVLQREAKLTAHRPTANEFIWQAIFLSIPFGFLLAAFDVTVKVQFSEPWSYMGLTIKAFKSAPVLALFIYLTNKHKSLRITQRIMTVGSIVAGIFLLYTIRHSPALGQMMRAPGLATIWIYFVIQLDLLPAVLSLLVAGAYWFIWETK